MLIKSNLNYIFFIFFLFLNKNKFFNFLNKKLVEVYLLNNGYYSHSAYRITKSHNNLFKGENIFIKNLEKLNIKKFIDIGANIGQYTVEILKNANTKVIAFEPIPKCCSKLSIIKKQFDNRFKYFQIALSNKNKFTKLNYVENKCGYSSLEKINKISYIKNLKIKKIKIISKKLDSFGNNEDFKHIDFIKIDTEGHEMEVLKGGYKFLKKNNIKMIQIEFNIHNLLVSSTIYNYSVLLPDYVITQLNPINGKLRIINPSDPLSNLFILSNFIFIKKKFFLENKKKLIQNF